ncbi:uncharacterized protein LOC108672372 isoform X2 [Hyalella azteca]|uniref:Uncharacterized protein LOC108672372 isoform X2 n=1 Tax=Hyalella azteca TaxID=294128 RepID=A0A8B7NR02_HYAAZ|nr:uncharacterized protein LOC108672372 isoform X2 [Hyalella azteca]
MSFRLRFFMIGAMTLMSEGQRRRCSEEISDIRKEISSLGAMQDDLLHALTDLRLGIESAVTVAAGSLPEDCSVAKKRGAWGPFQMIAPPGIGPRMVRCDMLTDGGGWTVALWREPVMKTAGFGERDGPSGDTLHRDSPRVSSYPTRSVKHDLSARPPAEKDPQRPSRNDILPDERHPAGDAGDEETWYRRRRLRRSSQGSSRELLRESFNRTWVEYKDGFGHHTGEYWIGNDVLHALTSASAEPWEALILLNDFRGQNATAAYGQFRVSDEGSGYRLMAAQYDDKRSTAGDGLAFHHRRSFSTYDRDNDEYHGSHCGLDYGAGWWFHQCHVSLLTGAGTSDAQRGTEGPHTLHWRNWKGEEALHSAALLIRPKNQL